MGFLNPTDDDSYRISAMPGTTEVPASDGFAERYQRPPK